MDLQTSEDRLSALPDGVIGHILSFLGAKEAARATALARRWRHAFAAVHTLSFEQEEGSSGGTVSIDDYNYTALHEDGCNAAFVALVDAAFASRRRCSAGSGDDPGLRAFRVAFDSFHHSLAGHVDRWLAAALPAAVEIRVDARRTGQRACARERAFFYYEEIEHTGEIRDESDGEDADDFRNPKSRDRVYRVPRELFFSSSAAARLRTLCLGSCLLDLPPPPDDGGHFLRLPCVETLALRRIPDSGKDIQRLVSACPRLADLTLDSCRRVRSLTVLDARLRRLALRCCHGARLTVDASQLRALQYKGPVPSDGSAVLSFLGSPPPGIVSCDIEFCGSTVASSDDVFSNRAFTYSDAELANLTQFLGRFADDAQCLRLGLVSLGAGVDKINGGLALAPFLCLTRLELKGALRSDSAVDAVTAILERTPNLEVLTLAISPDTMDFRWNEVTCDPKAVIHVPDVLPVIPCLQNRVREINVAHYRGRTPQRKLLKLLLRLASALDELYVVFPKGKYAVQSSLMGEIYSWVMNPSAKVMFA